MAKRKNKDIGLGDVVESVTKATGIKKVVETLFDDCGCENRKEKLNKIRFQFPVVRCFTEEQYNQWTEIKDKSKITRDDQINVIIPIYKHLFARQLKPMSCCIEPYIKEITRAYNQTTKTK